MCDDVRMMSGRQRVDTQGGGGGQCLMKNLEAFPCKMAIQGSVKTARYSIHSGLVNAIWEL